MIRDSPAELARAFAGPYASTSNTLRPRRPKCQAVHAPNTPAPITTTSYRELILAASYSVSVFSVTSAFSVVNSLSMSLAEKIQKDLTDAMRAKDELRLSVLRMVKSAITYKETEKLRKLDEPESIQLLQTLVKQRKESIDQFTKGNRNDLAQKETKELAIIESYLPAGASDAEMDAAIAKAMAESGATSIKQMGAVVKAAKAALEGKTVDGKALSDRVRSRLS
jgi:uncharacterized protein